MTAHTIRLDVNAYKSGRMLLNKRLDRVRIGDQPARPARGTYEEALAYLMAHGYELDRHHTRPRTHMGTVTVTYIFRKEEEEGGGTIDG